MSFCNSDFCPGCNCRNGCSCEADEAAANAQCAKDDLASIDTIIENLTCEMSGDDDTALAALVVEIRTIIGKYTNE